MPNYNYYKTISANMLVTTHDLNFVMGFIKEDEIYSPERGVRFYFHSVVVFVCDCLID